MPTMPPLTSVAVLLLAGLAVGQQRSLSAGGRPRNRLPAGTSRVQDFSCPNDFGYYQHPTDCSQYYVCVFGGALQESCTQGLVYSNELQTCDWPRNVICSVDLKAPVSTVRVTDPRTSKPPTRDPLTPSVSSFNNPFKSSSTKNSEKQVSGSEAVNRQGRIIQGRPQEQTLQQRFQESTKRNSAFDSAFFPSTTSRSFGFPTTGDEFSLNSLLNDCDDDEINNNDIRRSRRSIPPALYPKNSSLNHYKNYSVTTDMDTSASRHYNRLFHHNPHPNEPPSIEWHSANIDIRDFYDPYERATLGDYSSLEAGQHVNAKTKLSYDRQTKHGSKNFNYNSLNAERKYRHAINSGPSQLISRNAYHPTRYPPQIVNPYELKQPLSHPVRIRSTEKHLSAVKVEPIQPGQASSFSSHSSGSPFRTVYVSSEHLSEGPNIDTRRKPEPPATEF